MSGHDDVWLGAVVMHEGDSVMRTNSSHQTSAVTDDTVIDRLLQGTRFHTDLPTGKSLKLDGSLPKVVAYIPTRRCSQLLIGQLIEDKLH